MVNFPTSLDTDETLFLVHDSLRVQLDVDYQPGDTTVIVSGDEATFSRFPPTGIITLTEQCSEVDLRATTLTYSGKGTFSFTGCRVLNGLVDAAKPRRITNVTQNVMAEHHNVLKDSLIACQTAVGVQGEKALVPLSGTMEARINFLRALVLKPTAWFSVNKRIGILPLCVNFVDQSSRDPDVWVWDFGDSTTETINRSNTVTNGNTTKCYYSPGSYNVTLTVTNSYGNSSVVFNELIVARVDAPDEATIDFVPLPSQILSGGVIRTPTNAIVTIVVTDNGEQTLDPVVRYVWNLQDDLEHDTSSVARASYSLGGYYDVKVTTETQLGAYRTSIFDSDIDVVEQTNLWHFIFDPSDPANAVTKTVYNYEFGLLSEFYKSAGPAVTAITRNYNFLTGQPEQVQQTREFRRNNGFAPTSLLTSGNRGNSLLFWAEGAAANNLPQFIRFLQFNGFDGVYATPAINSITDVYPRFWNWFSMSSTTQVHFLFGVPGAYPQPAGSPTNLNQDSLFLNNYATQTTAFTPGTLLNGATDLANNPGGGANGDFSVYRAAWRGPSGYFLRNTGGGPFFQIKSFYMTDSLTLGQEIGVVRKLTDMPGNVKLEGQLVNLSSGLYFFNNTGEVLVYDPVSNIWGTGGPGVNSPLFTQFQDTSVPGYDNPANTLIAASDSESRAYLFFDYSIDANMSFNDVDRLFRKLPPRPAGEQFLAGIY